MELQERIHAAAAYIRSKTTLSPKIGLVLGSGLGGFADTLADAVRITNMAAGVLPRKLCHEEAVQTAARIHDDFHNLLNTLLSVL